MMTESSPVMLAKSTWFFTKRRPEFDVDFSFSTRILASLRKSLKQASSLRSAIVSGFLNHWLLAKCFDISQHIRRMAATLKWALSPALALIFCSSLK